MDIIEPCGFPLSDRSLKRAALDYQGAADLRRHDSWTDFQAARGPGRLVLFTTKAAERFEQFRFETADTLLFGRESAGVPDTVHDAADARLIIPIRAQTRSLNVVTAVAMALGEALRQTGGWPG